MVPHATVLVDLVGMAVLAGALGALAGIVETRRRRPRTPYANDLERRTPDHARAEHRKAA